MIASKLSQLIKAELEHYLADPNPLNLDPRPFVAYHNVLPLLADWNGFFGLRPNGDVLVFLYDDGVMVSKLETDTRIRRVALAQGAKTYAWLAELIPPRPNDAVDCSVCGGAGQIQVPGIPPDALGCCCGGLGWLAVEEQALLQRNHDNRANLSPS